MIGKFILWLSVIAFTSFGSMCLINPATVTDMNGLTAASGDAYVELGAMYGGLQTGFGLFLLLGALRPAMYRPALTSLVIVIGSLAVGRIATTVMIGMDVGIYTWGTISYELFTAIVAGLALRSK